MAASSWSTPEVHRHHEQKDVCHTRAKYREGRRPKAVKVYTINLESRWLLVQGVPALGVTSELVQLCALYGAVEEYRVLDEYPAEQFTDVFLIKFLRLQSARVAKRKLDEKSFFGGLLHVCYAPEFETVQDTREKLQDRRKFIARVLRNKVKDCEETAQAVEEPGIVEEAVRDLQQGPEAEADTGTDGESDTWNNYSDYYGYPMLPPPPQEDVHRFWPSPQSAAFRSAGPGEGGLLPAGFSPAPEDYSADSCREPSGPRDSRRREPSASKAKGTVSRFIPRTTHLQERKRRAEQAGVASLMGIPGTDEALIGPKLPETPKLDLGDDSLNTTANVIRSKLRKISSVAESEAAEKKKDAPKPRRRI
ncbi:RNA-binding protein 48 [Amia ocellicauda]|uniref:RNA-binding protein 48 n=1 Tax=Amia ocellicauda TaxID=2972642 RepID=UPI003463D6BA